MSELVCHTRPYTADLNLGEYMYNVLNRKPNYRDSAALDLSKSPYVYSYT